MKKIFKGIKFSKEDMIAKNNTLSLINDNRLDLIEKTFATGLSLYAKFSNLL